MADAVAVYNAVVGSTSQDPSVMQEASAQLAQWQIQPGFHATLQAIFTPGAGIEDEVARLMASMYFKNGVERYWRPTADNALAEEEKSHLRRQLLLSLEEPNPKVAAQCAVVISRLARQDVPQKWPELVPSLLEAVQSEDNLRMRRGLLYLYHTLKQMSSKRLLSARQTFSQIATALFPFLLNLWTKGLGGVLQSLTDGTVAAVDAVDQLELARLVLKALRQLLKHGIKDFHADEAAASFFDTLLKQVPVMLELREAVEEDSPVAPVIDSTIVMMMKTICDAQAYSPLSFARFMAPALGLALGALFNIEQESARPKHERFFVLCMILIKDVLYCGEYRPLDAERRGGIVTRNERSGSLQPASEETMQSYQAMEDVFTEDVLSQLCTVLVTKLLPLTQSDLTLWSEEPEEYFIAMDEVSESWKIMLRPCAEKLHNALLSRYTATASATLLALTEEILQQPSNDVNSVVLKDAALSAVGRGAYELYDYVDFDSWFVSTLLPMAADASPDACVVRRRVAWVAGRWVSVKMGTEVRPQLYQLVLQLLSEGEDLVVRMTAAETLKLSVDDFDFRLEAFANMFEPTVMALFNLLCTVEKCESKLRVLNALKVIIERLGAQQTEAAASTIAEYMPRLWEDAAEHNLLQCAIVETLSLLVEALNTQAEGWYEFLLPIIDFSTNLQNEEHVYLLENALDLWHEVLKRAAVLTPELLALFARLPPLLDKAESWMRTCLYIIESYVLLGQQVFLEAHGGLLADASASLLSEEGLRDEVVVLICKVVDITLTGFPEHGPELFQRVLIQAVNQVVGGQCHPGVFAAYMSVICRTMVSNTPVFLAISSQMSEEMNHAFWSKWIDKFDSLTSPVRRKLMGMGIATAVSLGPQLPFAFQGFPQLFSILVNLLHELMVQDGEVQSTDYLVTAAQEEEEEDAESLAVQASQAQAARKKELARKDPVHTINFREWVLARLGELQDLVGEAGYQEMMSQVDPDEAKQLERFL